jgi:hypothetical protein
VAGGAHDAEGAAQPEAFVNRFIAAINSKDSGKIMALIDSRSLACLTGENAPLLSFTLDNWMEHPISPRYNAQFKVLGPEALLLMDSFMPGRFDYPVRPTREVQIQADVTASNGVIVIAEIGLEAGEWKIILRATTSSSTRSAPSRPPSWERRVGVRRQFVPQLPEQSLHALRLNGLEGDPIYVGQIERGSPCGLPLVCVAAGRDRK